VVLLLAARASAVVSLVAEPRTELLYSSSKSIDCTKLHMEMDATKLPFNVVRLRALNDGAPIDTSTVKLQWSFRGQALGALAADLDLGPTGELPTVTSMCADFGNECSLAGDRLGTYDSDTIFYVAPTCEDLMRDPTKPFVGGTAKIRVKATAGRRKIGKADITIGFGNNGSTTLFVSRFPDGQFVDGIGRGMGVTTYANPIYAARLEQPVGVPKPPETYVVSGDLGGATLEHSCAGFEACEEIIQNGGKGTMNLQAQFEDGSVLCDNIRVIVATCSPDAQLDVIPKPKRSTYDPANPTQNLVDVTVRLKNTSKASNGLPPCRFLLENNIASCSSTLKVNELTETKGNAFALPHCSKTANTSCTGNGDCPAGERCLLGPYCSSTTDRDCVRDEDCAPPACPTCQAEEICVRVLDFPPGTRIFLEPGQSVDLVTGKAALRNHFKSTAALTDTWTVNVEIPAFSISKTLKYKIRGRP
jgi:hypothetical protein